MISSTQILVESFSKVPWVLRWWLRKATNLKLLKSNSGKSHTLYYSHYSSHRWEILKNNISSFFWESCHSVNRCYHKPTPVHGDRDRRMCVNYYYLVIDVQDSKKRRKYYFEVIFQDKNIHFQTQKILFFSTKVSK